VNDRSSALFGADNNLVLFMFINFLFSVLAPIQGVMSEAQRRAFGGDSIFVLSPPNVKAQRALLAIR
jgi:hypothetical protein